MLTKRRVNMVRSLSRKRNRQDLQRFIAEGYKSIRDLIHAGLEVDDIYVLAGNDELREFSPEVIGKKEMSLMSHMTTTPGYLAVFKIPEARAPLTSGRILILDNISDPGNLGTIVRLADWFSIPQIVCSTETVDIYNPKVVQATMGSLARVRVNYAPLENYIADLDQPVFYADMEGSSLYESKLPAQAAIILGSESHGVEEGLRKLAHPLSIPRYGTGTGAESLNVATAAAIITAEWLRATGM